MPLVKTLLFGLILLVMLHCHTSLSAQQTATWILNGMGDWHIPAHWAEGVVPENIGTEEFHVLISVPNPEPESVQVNVEQSTEISRLTLANRLAVHAPEFHIRDHFEWLAGTLTGTSAAYHLHGTALFSGNSYKHLGGICSLHIHQHARWTEGHLNWTEYGRVDIYPEALFQIEAAGTLGSVGTTAAVEIFNAGTVQKLQPHTSEIHSPFHNHGMLDIQDGNLRMMRTYDGQGQIKIGSGAELTFIGSATFDSVITENEGVLRLWNQGNQVLGETVLDGQTSIRADISGPGTLVLHNAVWEAGTLGGDGETIIPEGGKLYANNPFLQLSRSLINRGELTFAQSAALIGNFQHSLLNDTSGIVRLASGGGFGHPNFAAGTVINQGIMLKTNDSGTTVFWAPFENRGIVQVTAGRLILFSPSANSGSFQVQSPAAIEAHQLDVGPAGSLSGDGTFLLSAGTLRNAPDTNLFLILRNSSIHHTNAFALQRLQVDDSVHFENGGKIEVYDSLFLNGGMNSGHIQALGYAELNPGSGNLREFSVLDLQGDSAWLAGTLTVHNGSVLSNSGAMNLLGSTELQLNEGGEFRNSGQWKASQQVSSLKLFFEGGNRFRIVSAPSAPGGFPQPGELGFAGPIIATSSTLEAGLGAEIIVSDLLLTNASLLLNGAHLEVTTGFASSQASVQLEGGAISLPASGWTGSATLAGSGQIAGDIALSQMDLQPLGDRNHIQVTGDLDLKSLRVLLRKNGHTLQSPFISSRALNLEGAFELRTDGFEGLITTNLPITIIECAEPITGSFDGASSGEMVLAGSMRFRLFYGPGSPYGSNKLVIGDLGTPFDAYRFARFTTQELANTSVSGFLADPDGNGFNNLEEFVLAIETAIKPSYPHIEAFPEYDYTLIHVRHSKSASDFDCQIAVSHDLVTWHEISLGGTSSELTLHRGLDLGDSLQYLYRVMGAQDRFFLRTTITQKSLNSHAPAM